MYVSMKKMLEDANEGYYAILAINCFNLETARAAISAAEDTKAPIILNVVQEHMVTHAKAELMVPLVKTLAEQSSIPVALNLDHGKDFKLIASAFRHGFSSLMIDASDYPYEENVRKTKEVVKMASTTNLSVEGELGHVGDANHYNSESFRKSFTNLNETASFFEETGIDALAISFGTAHGLYKDDVIPNLDFDLLKEIKRKTNKPLVLHGGSGAGDDNIRKAVNYGINKINIGADIFKAGKKCLINLLTTDPELDLFDLLMNMEKACKEAILHYINLSGSAGKAN